MAKVDLVDCKIDEAWKAKMRLLSKDQIIDLFAKELERIKPMKSKLKKLQKYKDEHEAMLKDPKKHGEYLAGL